MVSEIIAFFIGLFTLFFGALIKKNIEEAYIRKRIATKLESYLLHWSKLIIDSETGLKLLYVGKLYRDQRKRAIFKKDADDYQKILKQQKKEIEDIYTNGNNDKLDNNMVEVIEQIKAVSKFEIDNTLQEIAELLGMIRNDKFFISDEEAAFLPLFLAGKIINLRLSADHILTTIRSLIISIRTSDLSNDDEIKTNITKLIWETIELIQKIELLMSISKKTRKKNILIEAFKITW